MRNNIASFEKSISSLVTICEKIDVEFFFALDFAQTLTSLLLDFLYEAILFFIYLIADKGTNSLERLPLVLCTTLGYLHTIGTSHVL